MTATMRQITPGQLIPDALAQRLAGHYGQNDGIRGRLAAFYWTGLIQPGTAEYVERRGASDDITTDARGHRDPQAIAAELRALIHYFRTAQPRAQVDGWAKWTPEWQADANAVVPWAWRTP